MLLPVSYTHLDVYKRQRLEGHHFDTILAHADPAVQDAFARGGDGMFSVGSEDDEDIYHLSRRSFRLNGLSLIHI